MQKHGYLSFSILLLATISFGQGQYKPRTIKVEGDYVQKETNIIFPTAINNYQRKIITKFNAEKTNIGVTYETVADTKKTSITVYVYPASAATEDRLRSEYLRSLQSIANASQDDGVHATQTYCFYKKDGYKMNGYKATVIDESNNHSVLEVYECGNWFLKIRITSNILDSSATDSLDKEILNAFPFIDLVKRSTLSNLATIYFAKVAFQDSLLLGCAMANVYAKSGWAFENIDSLEKACGFPGLYLEMHIAAWKAFAEFEKTHADFTSNQYTSDYLKQINQLIDSDYLDEFIMKEYSMVMIIPDDKTFDFEGFDTWKATHPITINLNGKFAVIAYEPEK